MPIRVKTKFAAKYLWFLDYFCQSLFNFKLFKTYTPPSWSVKKWEQFWKRITSFGKKSFGFDTKVLGFGFPILKPGFGCTLPLTRTFLHFKCMVNGTTLEQNVALQCITKITFSNLLIDSAIKSDITISYKFLTLLCAWFADVIFGMSISICSEHRFLRNKISKSFKMKGAEMFFCDETICDDIICED